MHKSLQNNLDVVSCSYKLPLFASRKKGKPRAVRYVIDMIKKWADRITQRVTTVLIHSAKPSITFKERFKAVDWKYSARG
jgi:hypothetical protein